MKKLTIIVNIIFGFLLSSCNYDYEYPDTSNGFIEYKIVPNLSKETKEKFKSIAKQYDSTVGTYENHDIWAWDVGWKINVTEKDKDNNVLYHGFPREKCSVNTKYIDTEIICLHGYHHEKDIVKEYQDSDSESYYEVCVFKEPHEVFFMPAVNEIIIDGSADQFVHEKIEGPVIYNYGITWSKLDLDFVNLADERGYEFCGVSHSITEKDAHGNILETKDFDRTSSSSMHVSKKGADYVDFTLNVLGWKKGNKYGTTYKVLHIVFKDIKLSDICGNEKYSVTTKDNYEIIYDEPMSYYYGITLGSDVISYMLGLVDERGYELSSRSLVITEKDAKGNVLMVRDFGKYSNEMVSAEKNAEYIDVTINVEGWKKGNKYGTTYKVLHMVFKDIKLSDICGNEKYSVTTKDNYEIIYDEPMSYYYGITLGSDVVSYMLDLVDERGYELSSRSLVITEKDAKGNVLRVRDFGKYSNEMVSAEKNAEYIDVTVNVEGWKKGNTYGTIYKVFHMVFKDIKLSDICGDKKYELSKSDLTDTIFD